jgi:hypothetical protein
MGCTSCKKKKELPVEETVSEDVQLSKEEIKQAYDDLTSFGGVKPEKRESINMVYQRLFGEPFNFGCGGCGSYQAKRFHNYIQANG